MIFQPVNKVVEKKAYAELIGIYIRIVELVASIHTLTIPKQESPSVPVLDEMIDMGIVDSEKDLAALKSLLGSNYYPLISSITCYLQNKSTFGCLLDKLSNKRRSEAQQAVLNEHRPVFVDLFAGAGGLSCGFTQAGFRVCLAVDHEDVCIRTYRYNHPELPSHRVIKEDIRRIVDHMEQYINEDVDIVVGGPPCQGFSSANQQRVIDDPRNELYKYFIEAIKNIAPKIVVMENVRGMLSVANQVVEDYQAIRTERNGRKYTYDVSYQLLNSANFGVAQNRERLIYIAVRNDIAETKNIIPNGIFKQIEASCANHKTFNLESALDCIKPLDAPRIKGMTETDDNKTGMKIGVNNYDSCGNDYLKTINCGRQIPFTFNHKARYCSDVNYEIFKRLQPGEDSTNPKIADIMPYAHRNGVFKDKYFRLHADRPCRTITAHLKMDCLSHIHPTQIRSITPREAARVQSFPDDYLFLGAYLKTYMQVGNAVPVLMAKRMAQIIKQYI